MCDSEQHEGRPRGLVVAGMLAAGYQLVTSRALSFRVLESGPKPSTFMAVPILAFAAPFLIMRNIIRGHTIEGRSFQLVMAATVVAGLAVGVAAVLMPGVPASAGSVTGPAANGTYLALGDSVAFGYVPPDAVPPNPSELPPKS